MKLIMDERFSKDKNGRDFMKTRQLITNSFFGISMVSYMIFWILKQPQGTPTLSVFLTCLFTPIFVSGLVIRSYNYFYLYNWYYALYLFTSLVTFIWIGIELEIPNYTYYFAYEALHLIMASIVGVMVSILVSIPFKIMHYEFLKTNDVYYDNYTLDALDKVVFPEKYEQEKKKKVEKLKYDTFNETQLQIELNQALKEERFEDAERIRKLLESKFG